MLSNFNILKKKFLNISIKGGIGNQLFQFVTAYSLSRKLNMDFNIDVAGYKNNNHRQFKLLSFLKIKRNIIKSKIFFFGKFEKVYQKIFFSNFKEKNPFYYDSAINNLDNRKNINLLGFFQSEKYFYMDRNQIIKLFNFNKKKSFKIIELESAILKSQSLAIHVRGGDYVDFEKENPGYGSLSRLYYKKAMKIITKNLRNFDIYIFTDDKSYFYKNNFLNTNNCTVVDSGSDINDLYLFSLCKNFIISNSTYSWWGAFLSMRKNKIIIAPKKWKFLDSSEANYYRYRYYI